MDNRPKERPYRSSVPQFGGWENDQTPGATSYTVVFTAARQQKKNDVVKPKMGLDNNRQQELYQPPPPPKDDSVMRKKKILTYINCCIKPA